MINARWKHNKAKFRLTRRDLILSGCPLVNHTTKLETYRKINKDEAPTGSVYTVADEIVDQCRKSETGIVEPEKWYVRQVGYNERVGGIKRFGAVPLLDFVKMWNRPFSPRDLTFEFDHPGNSNKMGRLKVAAPMPNWDFIHNFRCFIKWDELYNDETFDRCRILGMNVWDFPRKRGIKKWLDENVSEIYVFTDRDSIFVDEQEEYAYIMECV